jgi:hypothetical protein
LAVLLGKHDKAQAEAAASFDVANHSVGLDAAFLDKEVELGGHAFIDFEVLGLDEKAVDADVEDAGDIVAAVAAPANPYVFRSCEAS